MTEPVESSAYLEQLRADTEATRERVASQFERLTPGQRAWRPPEGGWGIADCLEHLTITDTGYLDNIERALAKRSRLDAAPPFKPGPWATRFIRMLQPGAKRRLKAPKKFRSDEGEPPSGALGRFLDTQRRLQGTLRDVEGFDLTRVKVASPVSGLIRFRLGDALRLMTVHDARHVAQAERVLGHAAFPAA